MTNLQKQMIIDIARNEYTPINGDEPSDYTEAETWANCVVSTSQDKGVLASLIKENVVEHWGSGEDSVLRLTEVGFALYKTL